MNPKQARFAEEFAVDHNATQAAIRAGYSPTRAKQTGSELLHRPDVLARITELDAEVAASLSVESQWVADKLKEYAEGGLTGLIPGTAGVKALEILAKITGMVIERSVELSAHVTYTLQLDRTLDDEEDNPTGTGPVIDIG